MTISAVLLAGGESRRMGCDKAMLPFRGEPLWKNQIELLRRVQPQQILVSGRIDPAWRPVDVEFVTDAEPSCGPISGIAAALSQISSDHLIVLAIDMPFMSANYLHGLFERVESDCGVVPTIEDRFEPLAAIYAREAKDDFDRALSGDDFSLQSLIRHLIADGKLRPVEVLVDEQSLFRNLNEPQDLADPRFPKPSRRLP